MNRVMVVGPSLSDTDERSTGSILISGFLQVVESVLPLLFLSYRYIRYDFTLLVVSAFTGIYYQYQDC